MCSCAHLYPEGKDSIKAGCLANTKASVSVQKTGRGSISHKVFLHCNKHRNFGAILGGIENLLDFEL